MTAGAAEVAGAAGELIGGSATVPTPVWGPVATTATAAVAATAGSASQPREAQAEVRRTVGARASYVRSSVASRKAARRSRVRSSSVSIGVLQRGRGGDERRPEPVQRAGGL